MTKKKEACCSNCMLTVDGLKRQGKNEILIKIVDGGGENYICLSCLESV